MKKVNNNMPTLFIGAAIGVLVTLIAFGALGFYVYSKFQSQTESQQQFQFQNTEARPNANSAFRDESTCPDASPSALEGEWGGSAYYPESGETQTWVNSRNKDGTYHLEFTLAEKGVLTNSHEDGYWSYSGCLYSVIVLRVNGAPVEYQEVYRVHEITDTQMKYTNFRSGKEFIANRM